MEDTEERSVAVRTTRSDEQDALIDALGHFWHPVCTIEELVGDAAAGGGQPLGVRLLERDIVVARLGDDSLIALDDRCVHRSTKLSTGTVDGCVLRCAYHGWTWDADGQCVSIPSLPDGPIPAKAVVPSFDVEERHGLIWVRLVRGEPEMTQSSIPHRSATGNDSLYTLDGKPYVWPVSALRRAENFFDLAHFAWVHDGSLGRSDQPVPPLPEIARVRSELQFTYDMPEFEPDDAAMYGTSHYRVPMPCTVEIDFRLESGARRILWMTASPIDRSTCRTFWSMSRDDDLHPDDPAALAQADADHLAFQLLVLGEDEPVVSAQHPGEFPLDPAIEVSVSTDLVSNVYRRWVRELVREFRAGGQPALGASAGWDDTASISERMRAASTESSQEPSTPSSAMSTMTASS